MPNQTMTIDQALSRQQPLSIYQWRALLQDLKDQHDLLELLKIDDDVLQNAVLEVFKRQKHSDWQPLYDFAREIPTAISRSRPTHTDVPLWRIVWQSDIEECQQWVIDILCYKLSRLRSNNDDGTILIDYFAGLAATHSALLAAHLHEHYVEGWQHFRSAGAGLLWQLHRPEFDSMVLALIAADDLAYHDEQALALTYQIIDSQPDYMLNVKPAKLAPLLIVLDEPLLRKVAPQLLKIIGKSAAQNLRETLAARFAQFDPDLLQELGWLDKKTKNIRLACLDILLQHEQPQALKHLRELYQHGGLDQGSKDRILTHLEAKGENIDDLDELAGMSLAQLAEQAAQLKKVSKAVEKIDHNALAEFLPELEPVLVRWLLQQMATAGDDDDGLPRSVRHVIQRCPLEQRQRFVSALVQQWLAYDGDPKMRWLLRLIPYGADDRLVPLLMDAVQAWHKKQKKRAAQAINALAEVDTIFALSQLKAISENRRYTDLLTDSAQQALRQAAKRRKQSLGDLYDELVPDFGLSGDGLDLDVGPYSYRLQLQGDLTLRVIAPNGKATKSLPKLKAQEDAAKHADADATFKRLRKSIKTVCDQQTKRMQTALISARTWPVSRWRGLFIEHPLLRQMSQTLIWSYSDQDGNVQGSFRLSEDLSLIDYQDEPVEVSEHSQVWLWHPIEADDETISGWREHIQDYALTPAVDQVNQPKLILKPEWLKDTRITAYKGCQLTQARFTGKMNQWGYRKGPVEDGGYIHQHYLTLPEAGLLVDLNHGGMPAWMELEHIIEIDDMMIYALDEPTRKHYQVERQQAIKPQQLPPVTVSMLLTQLQTLAQLAEDASSK